MGKTLKEWRELKGMSREELASELNDRLTKQPAGGGMFWYPVTGTHIARWEEVGLPVKEGFESDIFGNTVLSVLMDLLGVDEQGLDIEHMPVGPDAGHYVLNPAKLAALDVEVLAFLHEHAEELDLRTAVPNSHDIGLKPFVDVGDDDVKAIMKRTELERKYNHAMGERLSNMLAMAKEHSDDPEAKMGDILEEKDGRLIPKPPPTEEQEPE